MSFGGFRLLGSAMVRGIADVMCYRVCDTWSNIVNAMV